MEDIKKEQIEKSNKRLAKIIYENREKILADNERLRVYDDTEKKIIVEDDKEKSSNIISKIIKQIPTLLFNSTNNIRLPIDLKKNYYALKVKVEKPKNVNKLTKNLLEHIYNEQYAYSYAERLTTKDLKKIKGGNIDISPKYASKLKQKNLVKAKELYHGKLSNKQLTKYNNIKSWSVNISDENSSLKKLFEFKGSKKAIIGKNLSKSFSWLGHGMNAYTIATDNSDFKVALAGLDLLGDGIGAAITAATGGVGAPIGGLISGITSGISFVGSTGYDCFFKDTGIGEALDDGAGYIVNPIRKVVKGIKDMLFTDMTNYSVDFTSPSVRGRTRGIGIPNLQKTTKKSYRGVSREFANEMISKGTEALRKQQKEIKEKPFDFMIPSVKGRTRGIGIKSIDKPTQKLIRGVKLKQSKPYSNVIDMYHNNSNSIKNNNSKMYHHRGKLDNKLQGSQIDNSNKNNFTINITGTNKSTQEIMNEIVPEIKLRMKNISVA